MAGSRVEVRPGVWRLRVVVGYDARKRPKQVERTFKGTKKEADRALARLVTDMQDPAAVVDATVTVDAFLDRWIAHVRERLSPTTVRGYEDKLQRVRRDLGGIKLTKLSSQQLDRAYGEWLKDGLSASSVHGIHTVLSGALHQAEKWGLVQRAVTERATPPSKRTPPVQAVNPDDVVAIVAACRETSPVLSAAVVVSATTGLRRGELCGLRWNDLDFDTQTMIVRRAVKYGDNRIPVDGATKTHQERRLSLDEGTVAVLLEHRDRCDKTALDAMVTRDVDGYVFTLDPTGVTPWPPDSYTHAFLRVARSVGVSMRLHDLRHFVATHAIAAGVDVRTVAGRLGHADPAVTLKVYSSFVAARDRQAADVLGKLLTR